MKNIANYTRQVVGILKSRNQVWSPFCHLDTQVPGSSKKAAVVMAQSKPMGIWVNGYVARAQSSNMEDKNRLQELDRDNLKA